MVKETKWYHSSNGQEQVDNFMHYITYDQAENLVNCTNTVDQLKDNKSRDSIKQNEITYHAWKNSNKQTYTWNTIKIE